MTEPLFSTVSVIGLGYIGLPTAAVLASRGIIVRGVDINAQAVDTINSGGIHIVEPELDILVRAAVQTGTLTASLTPSPADAFLVAVPTPFTEGHAPDVSYVKAAALAIAPVLQHGNLVILESTSPVGTTEQMAQWLAEARPDLTFPQTAGDGADIRIAYCPERVLPGRVIHELVSNDRVIGGMSTACAARAKQLYQIFVRGECITTTARTAEMCKLTENAFRFVNIAFANELSMICDQLNIDVWELIRLANRHPRVNVLQPGPGVGGHCIAVDPWFIVHSAPDISPLLRAAGAVNHTKPEWVKAKVMAMVEQFTKPVVTVACLGVAFKADIDDLRESPSLEIVEQLAGNPRLKLVVNEPNITQLPAHVAALGVTLAPLNEALAQADMVLLLVDHAPYKKMDWSTVRVPVLDTKGVLPSRRG
jgi:UDP-N-acetyl-D-mannosaminuronic acid dehydrogenase